MTKARLTVGVLCDTSFLVCLNRPNEAMHGHARGYPSNVAPLILT